MKCFVTSSNQLVTYVNTSFIDNREAVRQTILTMVLLFSFDFAVLIEDNVRNSETTPGAIFGG